MMPGQQVHHVMEVSLQASRFSPLLRICGGKPGKIHFAILVHNSISLLVIYLKSYIDGH